MLISLISDQKDEAKKSTQVLNLNYVAVIDLPLKGIALPSDKKSDQSSIKPFCY